MIREIRVIKKPRTDPITDKPVSFPELSNLYLDMMEVKCKLKKGLPLITVTKAPAVIPPSLRVEEPKTPPPPITTPPDSKKTTSKKTSTKEVPSPTITIGGSASDDDFESSSDEGGTEEEFGSSSSDGENSSSDEDVVKGLGEKPSDTKASEEKVGTAEPPKPPESTPPPPEPVEEEVVDTRSPEEIEAEEKEKYLEKFRNLKKKHRDKTSIIPEFNEHSDLGMMKRSYERTVRELELDQTVESYRLYLVGGFMAVEFLGSQMDVDLKNFASNQLKVLNQYDRLLVELGEQSRSRWGSSLPVEIRLIGMILFNAALFYFGKLIGNGSTGGVADFFRAALNMGGEIKDIPLEEEPPKRKMRGPTLKRGE